MAKAANTQKNSQERKGRADHLAMFRWAKGQPSPNPSGRPKKRPITDRYEEVLEKLLPEHICKKLGLEPGATYGDAVAIRQVQSAIVYAKTEAAREIREAIEGKATQQMQHTVNIIHEITELEKMKAMGSVEKIKNLSDVIDVTPEEASARD